MASAIAGDYYATGNTLMRNAIVDSGHIRDTWVHTDASIPVNSTSNGVPAESASGAGDGIPINGNIEAAYLYWTSWVDANGLAVSSNYPDDCSGFGNWTRIGFPGGDTGWLSPISNAADTGGDGNGFEASPSSAYADDDVWREQYEWGGQIATGIGVTPLSGSQELILSSGLRSVRTGE